MEVVAEKSTSAQLKSIAQKIRGCRHELSLPEEHAGYIVELVERALNLPDAFSELDCLRREIGRLKYNYPNDWPMRALQAIARAFAPGFKPPPKFMEGGWFTGGWDDVGKIAAAIDREADRVTGLPEDAPKRPSDTVGPVPPCYFLWQGKKHELNIEEPSLPWRLLVFLWGKPSVSVADIGWNVWRKRRLNYEQMKTVLCRLNGAFTKAKGLPFISWTKKRGQNCVIYHGPDLSSSVAK
jgi:hypothetical protein